MKQPHPPMPHVRRRPSRLPLPSLDLIFFLLLALPGAVLPPAATTQEPDPAEPSLASLFPRRAQVYLEESPRGPAELGRLLLPAEVLVACRADLADLRLLAPDGRELPFLVDRGPGRHAERRIEHRLVPEILAVDRQRRDPEDRPSVFRESYLLNLPREETPGGRAWRLVLDTPVPSFVRDILVRDAAAGGEGEVLARGSLFRLGGDGDPYRERLHLELPGWGPGTRASAGGALRVEISGEGDGFLSPAFHLESGRALAGPEPMQVPLEALDRRREDGHTVLELSRPRGLIPELLVFRTADRGFLRPVEVWDLGAGRREAALGRDTLYSLGPERRHLEMAVLPPTGDRLRVVITDGDAPPLEELRVLARVRRPALVFPLPATPEAAPGPFSATNDGQPVASLLFGGDRAQRPRYGLQALAPRPPAAGEAAGVAQALYDPKRLSEARLGPVEDNPAYDPRPALAFARHPGAALDPAPYRLQRRLAVTPAPEGLHRLQLQPEDLAAARPDLADLRVMDGKGRQWAYLLEEDAARRLLALDPPPPHTEKRTSTYRLELPVAPVPADRLELDGPRPFFDRPYRLHGLTAPEGRERRLLASGRLVRRAEDTRPLEIPFPRTRLHGLELEVEDGDDAPLEWSRAELGLTLPALYVVADPRLDYRLLLGYPQDRDPRYEIHRVRDLVLAVESRRLEAGPLEINPAFRRSARWGDAAGLERIAFWAALGLAVLLMAWLTLRLASREGAD